MNRYIVGDAVISDVEQLHWAGWSSVRNADRVLHHLMCTSSDVFMLGVLSPSHCFHIAML